MRKFVMLAAMVAALGMASEPAEAGERGFGLRHFSPNAGAKFHRPHHGPKFHRRGFVGEPRHFKPRHFGHRGFVFKFGDGDLVFKFGHVPRFKRRHFGRGHGHSGPIFRFGQPRHLEPWHRRGFAFRMHRHDAREHFDGFEKTPRGFTHAPHGVDGGAPPEVILRQLEELGFRDTPALLRKRSH